MRELWQFTKLIRSKNAGPFELTFDIMFKDRESYERVLKSRVVSAARGKMLSWSCARAARRVRRECPSSRSFRSSR